MLRIAQMEMTIESVLAMSADQLADSSLQTLRLQQKQAAMLESQRNDSIHQELEARARETLLGNETWRSKGDGSDAMSTSTTQSRSDISSEGMNLSQPSSYSSSTDHDYDSADHVYSSNKPRSESPGTGTGKRSINVDAGTRMASGRPKVYRDPGAESMVAEPIVPFKSAETLDSKEDVAKPKTVNLLELLKSNKATTLHGGAPSPTSATSGATSKQSIVMPFYLLSCTGNRLFSVVRPGVAPIHCIGLTFDRFDTLLLLLLMYSTVQYISSLCINIKSLNCCLS